MLLLHRLTLRHRIQIGLWLPVARLAPNAVVVDLVYGDAPTPLVVESRRRGRQAIDGREVLLYQAIPQFRAMTGSNLPVELGRRVLELEVGRA